MISREARKEIAEVSGATVEEVDDVMHKKKYFTDFHAFLKAREARGDPMPETMDEL